MVEDIEPSTHSIIFARVTAFLQTIITGPLSVISAFLSIILCAPCIPCIITDRSEFRLSQFFENCVVGWGFFWLCFLLFFPLAIIGGIFFLIFLLIISPCYIYDK